MRWLWLIFISLFSVAAKGQVIVFDRTLSQPVYINDPGPSGISQLVDTLKGNGIIVSTIQNPAIYDRYFCTNNVNFDHLLFVLTPPIHRAYTQSELDNFNCMLRIGAHILIVAEHDNYYYNADNLNKICEPYGIKINNSSVKKDKTLQGAWPIGSSKKYGLNNIKFYLPAPLTCVKNAEVIATIDTSIVCASVSAGKGKITVLGDYEMLWNMTATEGIAYGDNMAFLTKLFHLPVDTTTYYATTEDIILTLKQRVDSTFKGRFLIAENIKNPNEVTEHDVVFFITPTKNLNWPDSIYKRIKKAVIVGGEYGNYLKIVENEGGDEVLKELKYNPAPLPINTIASHFNLHFSESVLNSGGLNNIKISSNPYCCLKAIEEYHNNRKESGSLITTSNGNFTTVYATNGKYAEQLYYGYLAFNESLGNDSIMPLPNQDIANAPLCLYDKRAFVISVPFIWNDLLSGTNNEYLLKAFNEWLQLK